jgi:hypothetical protein
MTSQTADPRSFNIVRYALLAGTLSFGMIAWAVSGTRGLVPAIDDGIEVYVWSMLVLVFIGLFGGVLAVRSKWTAAETFDEKQSANIVGWALAESAGLLGGLYLLMVGNPLFFGAGIALQGMASFVLLPVPER